MSLKRLTYDFDLHGGGVGVHDLGQGTSYDHQLLWHRLLAVYVFVAIVGNTDLSFGTTLDPGALLANGDFTFFPLGLTTVQPPSWEFTGVSPWAVTIAGTDITAGIVELIFETNRR